MKLSHKLAAVLLASAVAVPAQATKFIGDYTASGNSGSGLIVKVDEILSSLDFNLNTLNQSTGPVDLFKIYTDEADVGADDLFGRPFTVNFSFSSPTGAIGSPGSVGGTTIGESSLFGIFQNGAVKWNNSAKFSFANGAELGVQLFDTTFNNGVFGLNQGSGYGGTVKANFTLTKVESAVPEPATWAMMIIGMGAVGYSMRRRKSGFRLAQAV